MTDATGAAHDTEPTAAEPVEPPAAPGIAEPRLHADPPAGLAPPPGLAPSPGILPPDIAPPSGFALGTVPDAAVPIAPSPVAPVALSPAAPIAPSPAAPVPQAAPAPAPIPRPQAVSAPRAAPVAQPDPSPGKKRRLPLGAIIGIVAGAGFAAVLLLAIIGALFDSPANPTGDEPVAAETAAGTVEQFLTALSKGDAETAARLAGADADDPMLGEEVLARSLELAPISDIEVEDIDSEESYRHTVRATFDIGERPVSRSFTVWYTQDGWDLADALVALPLFGLEGFEVEVNGVATRDDAPAVFPGSYEIGLGDDAFEVVAENGPLDVISVVSGDDVEELYSADAQLTQEAAETFRSLVRASLEECLALTSLSTPCGLDVSEPLADGAIPIEGTAQRALAAEGEQALAGLTAEPDRERPGRVTTFDYIYVHTRIEADREGELISGTLYSNGELLQPYVDFSAEEPRVTWE